MPRTLDLSIFVLAMLLAGSQSNANVYSCRSLQMYNLSEAGLTHAADAENSLLLKFYKGFIFDDKSGVALFHNGEKLESIPMKVIQPGSNSNSTVAFVSNDCLISCPRYYIRIDNYKPNNPFVVDYFGSIYTGLCE